MIEYNPVIETTVSNPIKHGLNALSDYINNVIAHKNVGLASE